MAPSSPSCVSVNTGHWARYPAGYPQPASKEDWHPVAVSRRLSATGVRFSVILHPPRSRALLTVSLPDQRSGPRRGFRVPHIRAATGEGALCAPGTTVLIPDRGDFRPAPAASQRTSPCTPPHFPSAGIWLTRHLPRVHSKFARPVFPSPVAARMERAALGHEPRASHPADREPDDARRDRDRPSSTDLELHAQLTSGRSPIR